MASGNPKMIEQRAMSQDDQGANNGASEDIQDNSPLAERQPNLTLLAAGQNPGAMLRAAREKLGMSLSDVSALTKINERQLQALESGDPARLPSETFARAFIKSYCKAVKLDPVAVIAGYGFSEAAPAHVNASARAAQITRKDTLQASMPQSSRRLTGLNFDRKPGKSIGYGIVLAALVLMAVFYLPVFMSGEDAPADVAQALPPMQEPQEATPSANDAPSVPIGAAGQSAATPSSVFPALNPAPTEPTPAAPAATPAPTAAAPSAPAAPQAAAPAANSATVAAPAPSTAAAVVPPAPGKPAATQSTVQAATPATAAAPAVAAAPGALRFAFAEQSWVTVRDADDQVLVSQLNEAGSALDVKGKAPFKLIVGNAKAVKVTNNGKPVDLSTSVKGEVARLTVQ